MRKVFLALLIVVSGLSLSACAGGPSPSYVRGYNSNLDGGWDCSDSVGPASTDGPQFESGCEAAMQQWLATYDSNSNGPFGGGAGFAILPGNPKYKIAPIN
jgi:hypothetical protein